MRLAVTVFLVLAALNPCLFSGCSVKENRGPCPALLRLELPSASDSIKEVFISVENPLGEKVTFRQELPLHDTSFCYQVTREKFLLTVSTANIDGGLAVLPGEAYPHLYLYRARVRIGGESAIVSPSLGKEFCDMEINLSTQGKGLELWVRSNYTGIDPMGNLMKGEYSIATTPGGVVTVPRQGDNSLSLEVRDPEDGLLRSFALGEYLHRAGYDWTAPSLEDVSILINYARSTIYLSTWYWSQSFDVEIDL